MNLLKNKMKKCFIKIIAFSNLEKISAAVLISKLAGERFNTLFVFFKTIK